MTKEQLDEWRTLIEAAGIGGSSPRMPPPWWQIW
jgi:hypothetical protein